jgi:dipeptidyl aminopeptidase/acylaminoacyl peptidase
MKAFFFVLLLCSTLTGKTQDLNIAPPRKPALNIGALSTLPEVECTISNDCRYSLTYNGYASTNHAADVTLKNIDRGTIISFPDVNLNSRPVFTRDSKQLLYVRGKDSLCLFGLNKGSSVYIPGIHSFSLNETTTGRWLICKNATVDNQILLINLKTGQKIVFTDVASYLLNSQKTVMVLSAKTIKGRHLTWLNLATGATQLIYEGEQVNNFVFDQSGTQLVFLGKQTNGYMIWHYQEGNETARVLVTNDLLTDGNAVDNNNAKFNQDGTQLLFSVNQVKISSNKDISAKPFNVKVWNYLDAHLPMERINRSRTWATINLKNKKITGLNNENEEVSFPKGFDNYLLISNNVAMDSYYNPANAQQLSLIDIRDNSRIAFFKGDRFEHPAISPDERFVIWFDTDSLNWFSLEINKGIRRNISKDVTKLLYDEYALKVGRKHGVSFEPAAWSANEDAIYIYDQYDIWKVSLTQSCQPVNITMGMGRKENMVLGLVNLDHLGETSIVKRSDHLILSAYDPKTKATGFWQLALGSKKAPERGPTLPYAFYVSRIGKTTDYEGVPSCYIAKIGNNGQYLLTRQSAEEYPNYFITKDFKHYVQLTNFRPHKDYNWLTAELVNWQMTDGKCSQGVLYKPENFDPVKKYPLIFTYYEQRSEQFHEYLKADYCYERINIPYYVSNGYLVFVPDIYYQQGHNGEGVINSVVSAAKYLSKLPYVDSTKLGIQGHSFGGWETNFLVTHSTNLFTAACEASGVSNQISAYDQLNSGGSRQGFYETESQGSPYGFGVTPWTHPGLYSENSPVLFADKVTTPLLMMHGDKDDAVPYAQATEMFLALKRAGKRVWLLEYPNAGHFVEGADSKDYTIRMKQFFDHYLKGASPPKWMTEARAISQTLKDPYELDSVTTIP